MRIFSGSLPLATTNTFPTFPAAMPLYLSFKLITSRIRLAEDWEDPQIFVRHVFPPNFPTESCWVAKKRNLTEYQPVIFFVLTYETGLQKWWLLWYNGLKPRPTVQRTPGYASRCKASNYLGCCVNIYPISFQLTKSQCRSLIFITQDQRQWTWNESAGHFIPFGLNSSHLIPKCSQCNHHPAWWSVNILYHIISSFRTQCCGLGSWLFMFFRFFLSELLRLNAGKLHA